MAIVRKNGVADVPKIGVADVTKIGVADVRVAIVTQSFTCSVMKEGYVLALMSPSLFRVKIAGFG